MHIHLVEISDDRSPIRDALGRVARGFASFVLRKLSGFLDILQVGGSLLRSLISTGFASTTQRIVPKNNHLISSEKCQRL